MKVTFECNDRKETMELPDDLSEYEIERDYFIDWLLENADTSFVIEEEENNGLSEVKTNV